MESRTPPLQLSGVLGDIELRSELRSHKEMFRQLSRAVRHSRLHSKAHLREQELYESFRRDFKESVSPYIQEEDFFRGYEDVVDVEASLPTRGRLVLCPTPLGHLGDVSYRVVKALSSADILACEDTRLTGLLLQLLNKDGLPKEEAEIDEYAYGLAEDFVSHTVRKVAETRQSKGRGLMISFNAQNQEGRAARLVKVMKAGLTVVLASDAGTPLLSDPGGVLVAEAVRAGVSVQSLPGPVAAIVAVTASGFSCERFFFQGYLSKTESEKVGKLQKMRDSNSTAVIYESCHRIVQTLDTVVQVYGASHPIYVGQELTKRHEQHHRGSAESVAQSFRQLPKVLGELTVVLSPARAPQPDLEPRVSVDLKALVGLVEAACPAGPRKRSELLSQVTGLSRNRLTQVISALKREVREI